jgi:hypothetical protein
MSKLNVTAPQVAYAMSILEQFPESMIVRKDHYGALATRAVCKRCGASIEVCVDGDEN